MSRPIDQILWDLRSNDPVRIIRAIVESEQIPCSGDDDEIQQELDNIDRSDPDRRGYGSQAQAAKRLREQSRG